MKKPPITCRPVSIALLSALCLLSACSHQPVAPSTPSSAAMTPAQTDVLGPFRLPLLQGDMQTALQALEQIPVASLSGKDRAVSPCVPQRFASADSVDLPAGLSGPAADILAIYQRYWKSIMLKQANFKDGEAALLKALNARLSMSDSASWDRSSLEATTAEVKRYLEAQGVHTLTGLTRPFYELMLWTKESAESFAVRLPEQEVTVTVIFMDEFASKGWLSYASCDRYSTGGWAESDKLFAVGDSYDRSSEKFLVSYLGHEGQHFADYKNFPKLEQAELEYRAKLTEIALSRNGTRALLLQFARTAQAERAAPHPHAEYWLALYLSEQLLGSKQIETSEQAWANVGDEAIRATARSLLLQSSAQARAAGAATVSRLLPD
ncbi:hypothetical protein [Undibacterium sp.]|jgi:hypothetical protein|uniref:hypothetical protein n=1 Tax=Undibacterium sp. TaxID=1914977 RepID=UPI002B7370FC|nr:hypothetical protein [Undibacterium sp.]HTD06289.1 hypothetical protein [Undibacterium sp.]